MSFVPKSHANKARNGVAPNWYAAAEVVEGVQNCSNEAMRMERMKTEREEREEIITDLERILDRTLRLEVEASSTALSRVGIETKYLPLAWDHLNTDPQSRNVDHFFEPMSAEAIREHAPILVPSDDSGHGLEDETGQHQAQDWEAAPESEESEQYQNSDYDGDVDSIGESEFWDDRGIDDICPILSPDPEDDDLLTEGDDNKFEGHDGDGSEISEDHQSISSWLAEIEDRVEFKAQWPVLDSRLADAVDGLHIRIAYDIWRTFAELDRQYPPGCSDIIQLVSTTSWRDPLRLQKPLNAFGRYTNADYETTIPREYTPTHRWFVQSAFVATEGEPHEQFIVASPGPDNFTGGLVHSEIITILTAMITRYKSGRPHIKRQKVIPVMLISVIRNVVRVIQAHYDGESVIVRVSQANNPEVMTERNSYELFARYLASAPVGDTLHFPTRREVETVGGVKRTSEEAELEDDEVLPCNKKARWGIGAPRVDEFACFMT